METLKEFIFNYVKPNEEELTAFLLHIKQEKYSKGKRIIKTGMVSDKIYFVNKGLLKYVMSKEDGKEKAIHIAMENDLVADFFSFYSNYPAISSVETLTDCELLYIEKNNLTELYETYKVWEKFGRLVAEAAVLEQIMEKINFQIKTPEQRYIELITKKPTILQEVNLGVIAESLGITQETLSRIRSRI
jgi:CRP-like cAMP-binding protein